MKATILPSFDNVQQALSKTTLKPHPSQVHGLICGILCGGINERADWEQWVTGAEEPTDAHAILQELYAISNQQLQTFTFESQLLLPLDQVSLTDRAEALSLWCQGFLTGLKLVQVPIENRKPGEVTEAIDDLIEIAKMNYEQVVASEEDEVAYCELVEYVRMAAILIYQALRDEATSTVAKKYH